MRGYYFGCADHTGHHLYDLRASAGTVWLQRVRYPGNNPFGFVLDGELSPVHIGQKQGACLLHHKDGWTAIAWWDRSYDDRPGANAVFMVDGDKCFSEMIELFKSMCPNIYIRCAAKYEMTEWINEKSKA